MKQRLGFVSNSSSSSFVFLGKPEDFDKLDYKCIKIEDQKYKDLIIRKIIEDKKINKVDKSVDIYLTRYLSDDCDYKYYPNESDTVIEYCPGGHGYPYCKENYTEIEKGIWVMTNEVVI